MACKRVFLSGKVQGVSFRFHAYEKANKLGVNGWVRNLPDGRVELVVAGNDEGVENMIKWARKGPPQAEVKSVEIQEMKEAVVPKEPFYIRREGKQ